MTPSPGFEPGYQAPQACVLSKLDYEGTLFSITSIIKPKIQWLFGLRSLIPMVKETKLLLMVLIDELRIYTMDARVAIFSAFVLLPLLASSSYAAQPTACTSATNMSSGEVLGYSLNGVSYQFVENFVSPEYAGVTVNGASYTLYPNAPMTINSGTGAYIELTQVNYLPVQHSVDLILCSGAQGPGTYYTFNISDNSYGYLYFDYVGAKLLVASPSNISTPIRVSVGNVTGTTPQSQYGYSKLVAFNSSVTTSAPVSFAITQTLPCYVASGALHAYILAGGSWSQGIGSIFNASSCELSFSMPENSTAGIFYSSQGTQGTTSTTVIPSTVPSTSSLQATTTTTVPGFTVNATIVTTVPTTSTFRSTTSTVRMTYPSVTTTVYTTSASTTSSSTTTTIQQSSSDTVSNLIGGIWAWIRSILDSLTGRSGT